MDRKIDTSNSNYNRSPPQVHHYPPNPSYQSYPYPPYPAHQYSYEKKTEPFAILSSLFAIVSIITLFPFAGILPIILGIVSINQLNRKPEKFKGKNIAIAGIILGLIQIILWIIIMRFFFSW